MKSMNMAKLFKSKSNRGLVEAVLLFICVVVSALVFSCAQDSLFADISVEPEPRDPKIPGTLTNLVIADVKDTGGESSAYLYAAGIGAKRIYLYNEGSWSTIPSPGGSIVALASAGPAETEDRILYALSGGIKSSSLYRYIETDPDTAPGVYAWEKLDAEAAAGYSLDVLYGAGDRIFIGASKGNSYGIFRAEGGDALTLVKENTSLLTGAAEGGGVYYLAAGGSGILNGDDGASITGSSGSVTGIMNVNGEIVALTRSGSVYKCAEGAAAVSLYFDTNHSFSGGMSIWQDWVEDPEGSGTYVWKDRLLLVGVSDTSRYDKGYREIPLDNTGKIIATWRNPGTPNADNPSSSISSDNRSRYEASIDRYSIFNIIQVPDEVMAFPNDGAEPPAYIAPESWEPVIFATTANSGLMSLHDGQWNFE